MNLNEIETLAKEQMQKHNLIGLGWIFKFDNAKSRFGRCNYYNKVISISKPLALINNKGRVLNTILHEIAHALCDVGVGHSRKWKNKAIEVGCDAKRCYDSNLVETPKSKYLYICDTCGNKTKSHRKSKSSRACGKCCKKYSKGKYDSKFEVRQVINDGVQE